MPGNLRADLRRSLLIGTAEVVRERIGAAGVWIYERPTAAAKREWSYSTKNLPPSAFDQLPAECTLGYTVIQPGPLDHVTLSVLWHREAGDRAFSTLEQQIVGQAFARLRFLMFRDVSIETGVANRSLHLRQSVLGTHRLSPTELQVFQHLQTNKTEHEIATALRRSRHTVHVHVKNIYRKLFVNSRRELFRQHASNNGRFRHE